MIASDNLERDQNGAQNNGILADMFHDKNSLSQGNTSDKGSKDFEEFIYLLAHDVRNSTRALIELPTWIREDLAEERRPISKAMEDNLSLMDTHTRRLDRMLIDLLVHSRVGRMQEVESVAWPDVIDLALEQIQLPKGFEIICDFQCTNIRIGERDVVTLVSALVLNSIKHHDQDNGIIHIETAKNQNECVFTVRDDGPGIPEKYRERVFQAMTTLKPRDEVEGSGMGLAIVYKIVEVYGGSLRWAMGPDDRGATLEIRLPL